MTSLELGLAIYFGIGFMLGAAYMNLPPKRWRDFVIPFFFWCPLILINVIRDWIKTPW